MQSIAKQQIFVNCCICGKEFELSYNQKLRYNKDKDSKFVSSKECKSKLDSQRKTLERPKLYCCMCGKELNCTPDRFARYQKGEKYFYCRSCNMKKNNEKIDFEKRAENQKYLYEDKDWLKNRQEKTVQTNLEKYGVENVFQSKECKQKAKQTKLKKYGDENYNNREKMFKTMKENGYDIYAPRPEVGEKVSKSWYNKSEEERLRIRQEISKSITKVHNEMSLSRMLEISAIQSEAQKKRWQNTTPEQKEELFKKVFSHPNNVLRVISKTNRDIAKKLNITNYEKFVGGYSYDLYKEPNTLIEINPTYTHNCAKGTYYTDKHRDKLYHKNKTMTAIKNGYRCIHIWDWDDIDKIQYLIQDKIKIYARKLEVKEVSLSDTDEFLNKYHLQNTCKGQDIRLGLYLDNELIQIITFGKPRYNKKCQYELLRLCTKPEYYVIGGSEKLFNHFINMYKPVSIVSYCDYSKFTGDVYYKLGFKCVNKGTPSKHWCKGTKHITDNLLRQRGYDQLFSTNYGKGTSNEELMLNSGWLPVYDCGQLTFIWTNNK